MRYLFLIAFSFIFLTTTSYSQGHLSLQVLNEQKAPIEYANFRLFSASDSTVIKGGYSDTLGKIKLEGVTIGNYYGILTFFGFEDYVINEIRFIKANQKINLGSVFMIPLKGQEFDEVKIKGETPYMESSIDKRSYNVEQDMTSIGGEATDILNNIPSIDVDNDGNISLRGNSNVKILIDGRESAMTSGDDPLAGIPASAIEKVEVITNPSAKYNPEGTAGIINIVLKKKKLRGMNTRVQLTAATQNLYNGSIDFNFRNEKFNLYANYSFNYRESKSDGLNKRYSEYNDTTEFLDQVRDGSDLRRSHTANIGADFFIKKNQVIGVSVSGRYADQMRIGDQDYELNYNNELDHYWNRYSVNPTNRRSIDINANYKLDFNDKKGNLIIAGTQSLGHRFTTGEYRESHFLADGTPYTYDNSFQTQGRGGGNNRFTFSADLTRSINEKFGYETGLEARINGMNEKNTLEDYDTLTGEMIPNLLESNELKYSERTFSAYGIFKHKVTDIFKYQAGLRLEQAFIDPRFAKDNYPSLAYKYFSFFPSAHLSLGDEKHGNLFASYSRRINRPNAWNLNPFPIYSDPLNLRTGNPNLRPEYINSYELGYEKIWEKATFTGTLYFKETVDKIQRIKVFQEDGVAVSSFANIDKGYDYGVELIGTYNPFSWWKNMLSFNAYESRLSSNYNGMNLSNKGISWDVKMSMTFSLFKNTTHIQVNGGYFAPRYTVQGTYQFSPGFDVGITRSFFDKKLVVGFRVSDVFNQKHFSIETFQGEIRQEAEFKWTTRRFFITLSYKFGNLKVKETPKGRPMEGGGPDMM